MSSISENTGDQANFLHFHENEDFLSLSVNELNCPEGFDHFYVRQSGIDYEDLDFNYSLNISLDVNANNVELMMKMEINKSYFKQHHLL